MRKLAFLVLIVLAVGMCVRPAAAQATWPGQCPTGTVASAIGCQPKAAQPAPTDLTLCWELGQTTPHTRACQIQQLLSAGPVLQATNYGVVADGITQNDVALKAALDDCSSKGASLQLPAGKILLAGQGGVTSTIHNCSLVGVGFAGGLAASSGGTVASFGTTILLTSTTVKPFILKTSFAISGINFFWPNQHGSTVYPALFSGDGTLMNQGYFNHDSIVNAYDGFVQAGSPGGSLYFTNNAFFAVHDMFNISGVGDGFSFANNRWTPGPWLNICSGLNCTTDVGTAASNNRAFHATGTGPLSVSVQGDVFVGWEYGFLVDASSNVSESSVNATWDAVGTIIDTSSGGTWATGQIFTGLNSNCGLAGPVWGGPGSGNAPCFNLGSNGTLELQNFNSAGGRGSFIVTSGTNIRLVGVANDTIGGALDGADYSQISVTSGGPLIEVSASAFSGNGSVTNSQRDHVHGITTSSTPNFVSVNNTKFIFHYDVLNMAKGANGTILNGVSSFFTRAAASVTLTGASLVTFVGNQFDKPPNAVVKSGFGTSPSIVAGVDFQTFAVNVGTGGSASTGVITMPIGSLNGWVCNAIEETHSASFITVASPANSTDVVLSNYSRTTGLGVAWTSGDKVTMTCSQY